MSFLLYLISLLSGAKVCILQKLNKTSGSLTCTPNQFKILRERQTFCPKIILIKRMCILQDHIFISEIAITSPKRLNSYFGSKKQNRTKTFEKFKTMCALEHRRVRMVCRTSWFLIFKSAWLKYVLWFLFYVDIHKATYLKRFISRYTQHTKLNDEVQKLMQILSIIKLILLIKK